MKVILLKSVPKLGKKDDIITVPDGYAQNALFPKKLAILATDQAVAALKRTHENTLTQKKIQHELLDKAIESLEGKTLVYATKKNEKGHLFSKVTELDISKVLMDQHRISIDPKLMTIRPTADAQGSGPSSIKQTGSYVVDVKDGDYQSEFTIVIQ